MWVLSDGTIPSSAVWLLVGAMAAFYVASRGAVLSVVRAWPAPGLRGVAQSLPLAATAYIAFIMGRPSLALAVCMSTAVAALSLVNGIVLVMSPGVRPNTPGQRAWPLTVIAGGILFLAGFSGHLSLIHAVILLLEGVVIHAVWNDPAHRVRRLIPEEKSVRPGSGRRLTAYWQMMLLMLSLGVAVMGAWAVVGGAKALLEQTRLFTIPLVSAGLIAPMVILPVIGTSGELSHLGRTDEALGGSFAVSFFSLCAVVPSLVILHHVKEGASLWSDLHGFRDVFDALPPLTYPLTLWRLDTIALLILGLFYLPAALGKWTLTRWEGIGLIALYVAYLAGQAWLAGR